MIFLSRALEERSFAELADEFHIGYSTQGLSDEFRRNFRGLRRDDQNV